MDEPVAAGRPLAEQSRWELLRALLKDGWSHDVAAPRQRTATIEPYSRRSGNNIFWQKRGKAPLQHAYLRCLLHFSTRGNVDMNVMHLQPTQYYNKLLGITKLNTRHCRLDMHLANISEEADEIPDEAIRPSKKRRSQDEPRAARAGAQGSAQDTVDLNVSSDEEGGASSDAQSETHESGSNASSSSSPASPSGSEAESSCIPDEAGDPNVGHESGNQNFTTKDGSGTEHWHGFFPFRDFLSRWGATGVMVECQHPCHNSTSHCSKSLQDNLVRSRDDCVMLLKLWIVRCELEPNTKEAHKAVWVDLWKEYRADDNFAFPADLEQKGLEIVELVQEAYKVSRPFRL